MDKRSPGGSDSIARLSGRALHAHGSLRIERELLSPDDPLFGDPGPASRHALLFARSAFWVEPSGEARFVADPNMVTLCPQGQEDRFQPIDAEGLDAVRIAPGPELLATALAELGLDVGPSGPFTCRQVPVDGRTCLLLGALVRTLETRPRATQELIERAALQILLRCLVHMPTVGEGTRTFQTTGRAALAERAREILNRRSTEGLSAERIAREVGCSPFHLTRLFRERFDLPLQAYRNQLRVRAALHRLLAGDGRTEDLGELAVRLGYSGHSHLTSHFSRSFGLPPSWARGTWSPDRLAALVTRVSSTSAVAVR
jgi:AraC-like DNA-binding protein